MTYGFALITGGTTGIGAAFAKSLPKSTNLLLVAATRRNWPSARPNWRAQAARWKPWPPTCPPWKADPG